MNATENKLLLQKKIKRFKGLSTLIFCNHAEWE